MYSSLATHYFLLGFSWENQRTFQGTCLHVCPDAPWQRPAKRGFRARVGVLWLKLWIQEILVGSHRQEHVAERFFLL